MSLNKSEVAKIAHLARLDIGEQKLESYSSDLNNILNFVESMNAINTEGIAPLAHPLEITARCREDVVTETDQRNYFQQQAPAVENGHYLVPKVIE